MKQLLDAYLKSIAATTMQGDAREESYYPALKTLFSDFPLDKDRKTKVTVLPKATEAGNPDFRIWDGEHFIVGYIEAKAPGTNLDQVETSEQLERYRQTFPNLILTDFYEFRLYRDGREVDRTTIARHFTAQKLRITPTLEKLPEFQALAERFFSFKLPLSYTAESLAVELAKRTRFLRDQVVSEELKQAEQKKGGIYGFYEAFQKYLLPNLTLEQFADLYSQTLTYGLFAARTRSHTSFNRRTAIDFIPSTIGILRDVFQYISLERISEQMEVIIDDIVAVLNVADINSILEQYYQQGKGEDPVVHFYETFLNHYDPKTRERRGVYYTPEPVVKYIVKSVHHLLKTRFNLADGLADPSVTLLDPAAGTLAFPAEAIKLAVQEYVQKYGEGGKKEFIRNQVLRNFYAFELMMAPYAIGHLKISFLLESLGYHMREDERFKLYLTNTLEMEEIEQIAIPGVSSLSEESHLAGKVKKDEPILVIMGNPPYSGNSANRNDWTEKLLKEDLDGAQSYYKVDGKPLGERNPKWIQDDYVKFLRFAQWKIQRAGKGIVAMITNHAYLDNPTFRGMRQSLLRTFDEIHVLDLHGNSMKKETAPDGGKDENVFDIRVGTAIAIFVKNQTAVAEHSAKCFHADLFGSRLLKYNYLETNQIENEGWHSIQPSSDLFLFLHRNNTRQDAYNNFIKITKVFDIFGIGIATHRDKFVVDENKQSLLTRINQFQNLSISDELIKMTYSLHNTRDWDLHKNRQAFQEITNLDDNVKKYLYRPFDSQYVYYHQNLLEFPRYSLMRHLESPNNVLAIGRQGQVVGTNNLWNLAFVSDSLVDVNLFRRGGAVIFPLYLYQDQHSSTLFSNLENEKSANFSSSFLDKLNGQFMNQMTPENIMSYIYAILYSNKFRLLYREFLLNDYPHIPFTANLSVFKEMADLGRMLINVHLLESSDLSQSSIKYQGQGDDHTIERPKYSEAEQRLYINPGHYFEGLTPQVWHYQIGGYQVLDKYLKDRKGQKLDDPRHYIRVVTALAKTIEIQKEIDAIYPEVERNVISFSL